MEKERLFKLTCALYRVTELVPENEPLRILIRKKALALLFLQDRRQKDIEILLEAFELAQKQHWVEQKNFLILAKEYNKLKQAEPKKIQKQQKTEKKKRKNVKIAKYEDMETPSLKGRQGKLAEILKQKGQMQVGDLEALFPEVTKRTLRRDMVELTAQGVIERVGQGIRTFYRIRKTN